MKAVHLGSPGTGEARLARGLAVVEGWVRSAALAALVASFGGDIPHGTDLDELLRYLDDFSERWDFRRGAERLDATRFEGDSQSARQIEEAAAALGLTDPLPPQQERYDYVIVLGGVAQSCLLRTRLAADFITRGVVVAPLVALLGAWRPVSEREREDAERYSNGAATEFDLMNAAAEQEFSGLDGYAEEVSDDQATNQRAVVRRYQGIAEVQIVSLCAPSSDPARRANTEDTYAFFADAVKVTSGQNCLICTSQIYHPFHVFGAIRMLNLPYDVDVEVVGYPPEWGWGQSALRDTHNLLQEIRSAIQAAVRLKADIDRRAA